jgi:uncharacterized membrane protein
VSNLYNPYAAPQAAPPPQQDTLGGGTPQPWTVGEVISLGWERFKQNWAVLVFSYLLVFVVLQVASRASTMALDAPPDVRSTTYWAAMGVSSLVTQIVNAFFRPGLVRIWLSAARGQSPSFGVLFSGFDRFLPMLGLTLLTGIAYTLGFALLIVPGVILMLGFFAAEYYVVEGKMGPIDAMKASWDATKGNKGDLLLLALAGLGLFMLGGLMCFVGLFATFPIFEVAAAASYTRMSGNGSAPAPFADQQPPPPPPGLPPSDYGPPPGYGSPPGY